MSDIPEWAFEVAAERCNLNNRNQLPVENWKSQTAFNELAKTIATHEQQPVDPLLIEARKIATCARRKIGAGIHDGVARAIESGGWDDHSLVDAALAALHRGIELGKSQ